MDKNTDNKRYLVIHADDFGQQYCCNEGIFAAARNGLLSSTCLRANGVALREAIDFLPSHPGLGVGVHICLNEGPVLAPPSQVPLLADGNGNFRYTGIEGFVRLGLMGFQKKMRQQVETEMRAQIEALMEKVALDHLNGHLHVHAIPWIFKICLSLCEEYGIPFIRLPFEPFNWKACKKHFPSFLHMCHYINLMRWQPINMWRLKKTKVHSNTHFLGLLHSSHMTKPIALELLETRQGRKITEILFHPAIPVDEKFFLADYVENFCLSPLRLQELAALTSLELKDHISKQRYTVTNYRELAGIRAGKMCCGL